MADKPSNPPPRWTRAPRFLLDLSDLGPEVDKAAAAAGGKRAKWARRALREYLAGRGADAAAAIDRLAAEVTLLNRALNATGNNLNQIARALNAGDQHDKGAIADTLAVLSREMAEVRRIARGVARALRQEIE